MPELPEVETLRRSLEARVVGQRILDVEIKRAKLISGKGNQRRSSLKKAKEFKDGFKGEVIKAVARRAKNLIFRTQGGKVLLVHLKMSGQFIYEEGGKKQVIGGHPIRSSEENALPNKHTHIIFSLERGTLFYNDIRMFGYLIYYPNEELFLKDGHFRSVGPEPLDKDFSSEYLSRALSRKKGKIKAVLMNQDIVAGLGNIYADEALFEAGIRPDRAGTSLKIEDVERLRKAIIRILKRAISLGGSSVATYRLLDRKKGNYAREHKVYGKGGRDCPICGTQLSKMSIQSRTTVYCSKCQK